MIATYHKKENLAAIILLLVTAFILTGTLQASHPYNPFVITVKDADTGAPIPLVKLKTVNKITYLTDSNGQIAFWEPGLTNVGDVYFHVESPYGYLQLDADFFGNRGKTFNIIPGGSAQFTLQPEPSPGNPPAYTDLELFRLEHNYNTTSGTFSPFMITVRDSVTSRGVPLVELRTNDGFSYITDSAGRIAFYEPDLMDRSVFFNVKSYGYDSPSSGGVYLVAISGGSAEFSIVRENLAERLYRITGEGIYNDSVILEQSVPLAAPVLSGKVVGQDTVDMTEYNGKLFWLWGDTERPAYPLGNFKTSCATSGIPGQGGLDPDQGIDLTYFVNNEGFSKEMFPRSDAGLVWMNSLVSIDDSGSEKLLASYSVISGQAEGETGIAIFNDTTETFEPLTIFQLDHNIIISGQAHKKDGYVYINCPYPTVRIKADIASFANPSSYEAFTCLAPGTAYNGDSSQVERDSSNNLIWNWKANTSPIDDGRWSTLRNAGLVSQDEAWNWLIDIETNDHVLLAGGSAGYNPYKDCWVMIGQQQFGKTFLGEAWVAVAKSPQGPWTKARKVVTHWSSEDAYTFYNVAYHPEFNQDNGRLIYFEGTYVTTYTGNENPTPRYDYNQVMYRLDLSDSRLDNIWPQPDPEERMLAHWQIDQAEFNANGVYVDLSGQGHDAAVSGSPQFIADQNGNNGSAVALDGANGWARAGNWDPGADFGLMTISLWFKYSSGQGGTLIAKRDSWDMNEMMWQIGISDNKISYIHAPYNWAEISFAEAGIQHNQWHMLTVMHDRNTNTLDYYIDTEFKKSFNIGLASGTDAQMVIGMSNYNPDGTANEPYTGQLDDIRVYNYQLDQKEMLDVYDAIAVNKKYICTEPYPAFLDVAGPGTIIEDINTFQPEPDCEVNLYDFAVFALGWLSDGYYPK